MNDWSEWEKKNAERLAREAEKKFGHLPNWGDIKQGRKIRKTIFPGGRPTTTIATKKILILPSR